LTIGCRIHRPWHASNEQLPAGECNRLLAPIDPSVVYTLISERNKPPEDRTDRPQSRASRRPFARSLSRRNNGGVTDGSGDPGGGSVCSSSRASLGRACPKRPILYRVYGTLNLKLDQSINQAVCARSTSVRPSIINGRQAVPFTMARNRLDDRPLTDSVCE